MSPTSYQLLYSAIYCFWLPFAHNPNGLSFLWKAALQYPKTASCFAFCTFWLLRNFPIAFLCHRQRLGQIPTSYQLHNLRDILVAVIFTAIKLYHNTIRMSTLFPIFLNCLEILGILYAKNSKAMHVYSHIVWKIHIRQKNFLQMSVFLKIPL